MFGITLVDHLRMTFGSVVRHHEAHLRMSQSRVRWSRGLRALEALLMIAVVAASIQAASGASVRAAVVAAALAVLALATLILHLTFDLERSAQAHASCAARLWQIREQYRALLSDLADGAIGIDMTRQRRDELIGELQAVYQIAPFESAHRSVDRAVETLEEAALTDLEIDRFLPPSLQKGEKPPAVA
jgi:hypothetical protein